MAEVPSHPGPPPLTSGVTARIVDLHSGSVIKLHDEAVVVSLFPTQVGTGSRGKPEQVVVALEVACKEEVRAKGGDVFWQIADGNVEVPAQGHRVSPEKG
jgi:hypothetical protein